MVTAYSLHPLTKESPAPSESELVKRAQEIKAGASNRIMLYEGKIMYGYVDYLVCKRLRIQPRFVTLIKLGDSGAFENTRASASEKNKEIVPQGAACAPQNPESVKQAGNEKAPEPALNKEQDTVSCEPGNGQRRNRKPKPHNGNRCLYRYRQRIINARLWGDSVSAIARALPVGYNTVAAIRDYYGL